MNTKVLNKDVCKNGYKVFAVERSYGLNVRVIPPVGRYTQEIYAIQKGEEVVFKMQTTTYGALSGADLDDFLKSVKVAVATVHYFNKLFNRA